MFCSCSTSIHSIFFKYFSGRLENETDRKQRKAIFDKLIKDGHLGNLDDWNNLFDIPVDAYRFLLWYADALRFHKDKESFDVQYEATVKALDKVKEFRRRNPIDRGYQGVEFYQEDNDNIINNGNRQQYEQAIKSAGRLFQDAHSIAKRRGAKNNESLQGETNEGESTRGRIHEESSRQQEELISWAKKNNNLIVEPNDYYEEEYGESQAGNESTVWITNDNGNKVAIKSITLKHYTTPEKLLDRILIHNAAFPSTAMQVLKIGTSDKGISIIVKQPWIEDSKEIPTYKEIEDYMAKHGFKLKKGKGPNAEYSKNGYVVSDIRPENVIKQPDGTLAIIDCYAMFEDAATLNEHLDEAVEAYIDPNETISIEYTPTGKARQTYTVKGDHIYNKQGKEVFAEDSKDRTKILANVAVQQKQAVVVTYKDNKYVVDNNDKIVSVTTGNVMQWEDNNGNRKNILALAAPKLDELKSNQVPQHFKSAREVSEFFGPYYEGGGTDINNHYHVTQEEDRFLNDWIWGGLNYNNRKVIEIANRVYARGRKQSPLNFPSSLSKTAEEGVVIDPNLKQNYAEWQKENPDGIVAYRVNFNSYNTPEEVQAGRIGNPFSESERGEATVEKFYKWLITGENFGNPKATEAFRQAIIDKILNTPADSPILYYKDLGRPSHATVIGYLVNHKEVLPQQQEESVVDQVIQHLKELGIPVKNRAEMKEFLKTHKIENLQQARAIQAFIGKRDLPKDELPVLSEALMTKYGNKTAYGDVICTANYEYTVNYKGAGEFDIIEYHKIDNNTNNEYNDREREGFPEFSNRWSTRNEFAERQYNSDSYNAEDGETNGNYAGLDNSTQQGESEQVESDASSYEHQEWRSIKRDSATDRVTFVDGDGSTKSTSEDWNEDFKASQNFTTSSGTVYGFVDRDGNIYLDEEIISAEHGIHEYTHLWDRVVQKHNPALWQRGVELMKKDLSFAA